MAGWHCRNIGQGTIAATPDFPVLRKVKSNKGRTEYVDLKKD